MMMLMMLMMMVIIRYKIDDCDDGCGCDGGVGHRCARGVEREPGLSLKLRGLDAIAAFRFINDMTRQKRVYHFS